MREWGLASRVIAVCVQFGHTQCRKGVTRTVIGYFPSETVWTSVLPAASVGFVSLVS